MGNIRRNVSISDRILLKYKKNFCRKNGIEIDSSVAKKKRGDSRVLYLKDEDMARLNPYLSSIIGFAYLNLDYYRKIFNVFYEDAENSVVEFYFGRNYEIDNWQEEQISSHLNALKVVGDFLGCDIKRVDNKEDADLVFVKITDFLDWIYSATSPHELDIFETLQGKGYAFYSGMFNEDNVDTGSVWFMLFMASFLKILGLVIPMSTDNMSKIMPGVSSLKGEDTNGGIFEMNNVLVTIMSDKLDETKYVNNNCQIDWMTSTYPRTLMALDIQALKYIYDVEEIPVGYKDHLDLEGKEEIVQTLVSGKNGLKLVLRPERGKLYNLFMDSFNANPVSDGIGVFSALSRIGKDKYGCFLIDRMSYLREVEVYYEEVNIYASKFLANSLIKLGNTVERVNIFLANNKEDYEYIEDGGWFKLINKKTKRGILIKMGDSTININFSGVPQSAILDEEEEMEDKEEDEKEEIEEIEEKEEIEEREEKEEIEEIEEKEEKGEKEEKEEKREIEEIEEREDIKDDVKEKRGGNMILDNLRDEHYEEIIRAFRQQNGNFKSLNDFAIDFIIKKFRNKIEGQKLPRLVEIAKKMN